MLNCCDQSVQFLINLNYWKFENYEFKFVFGLKYWNVLLWFNGEDL